MAAIMHKMAEQPKHRQLYHELRQRLIKMEPGSSFYSIRDLMHNFEVSQATVSKAVEALCDDKLLDKNVGSGTFVTEEVLRYRDDAQPVICLAIPCWMSNDFLVLENEFSDLQDKLKYVADVIHFKWRDGVIRELPAKKIDGLIVAPASEKITDEHIRALNQLQVPYVIYGQQLKNIPVNSVYSDDEYAGSLAADHLIKLGHKRLAILVSEPRVDDIEARILGFERYCRLQNVTLEIIDCDAQSGDNTLELAYQSTKRLLMNGMPDFTGVFVVCESNCQPVYKAFHEAGVRIPGDVSVISLGNVCNSGYWYPALTTVDLSFSMRICSAVDILKEAIKNKAVETAKVKKCVDIKLVIRESTAKCERY